MKSISQILLLTTLLFATFSAFAQTPTSTPTPTPLVMPSPTPPPSTLPTAEDDGDVVKITTNLIQVDVIVTDKKGKRVVDLKPEDFEVYENGKIQELTNFSFINTPAETLPEKTETPKSNVKEDKRLLAPVSSKINREKIGRTIALVVDDLGLSFSSVYFVQSALKKFVDEQMKPGDLVAIIRTGGGIGALQSFTADKRQLYAAIEKVRWNPAGRAGIGVFTPIEATLAETLSNSGDSGVTAEDAARERQAQAEFNQFREDIFSVGTLGSINYIVRGMGDLPGRKSILLFSDGFKLFTRNDKGIPETDNRIFDGLRRLTELANRSSVAIYTADARGLVVTGLTAEDNTNGLSTDQIQQRGDERNNELRDNQDGLIYLAQETGGRAFINNNDLNGMIRQTLDDQNGYYLLGYQPDSNTFDAKKVRFNKLTIKLKRPGLSLRYRSGFFDYADNEARPTTTPPNQQILNALTSPFGATEVALRLNSLFVNDEKTGSYIRSLIYIQGRDLKFVDEAEGWKKAVFDVLAVTFGDNGVPIDQVSKTYTFRVKNDIYQQLNEKGFVYNVYVPIKKAGAYQLRIALRDDTTAKVGSASQFIEVPDLKKKRLTTSGIFLKSYSEAEWQKLAQNKSPEANSRSDDANAMQTDTALRRYQQNSVLTYGYAIYNAKIDNASQRPNLQIQTRVFRDGKLLFAGKPQAPDLSGQTDIQRIAANGAIALGTQMQPGDYILQVVITDKLAKEKNQIATQFVEFEVIK